MNWDAIGTIAELIGAAGVILSLVYVGKQLRQTNATSRSSVHVARAEAATNLCMNVSCSPPLAEALAKVHYHDLLRDDATELERIQLGYLYTALANQLHMGFEQRKEGLLSREELEEYMGPASGLLSFPYLQSVWPGLKNPYPADFQEWFEARYIDTAGGTKATAQG